MTTKYIVSKKLFHYYLSSADGMLDSLGRFSSIAPFSHRYYVGVIRRYPKPKIESFLKETYIPGIIDWMIGLENAPFIECDLPKVFLTQSDVSTTIQNWESWDADLFIRKHLKLGLMHLIPEPELNARFDYSNELTAWKVTDQLSFMCDHFSLKKPAWLITAKTSQNESHILSIHMKYGIVNIVFYYPTTGILSKSNLTILPDAPKLH